jgi:hypothetical protein
MAEFAIPNDPGTFGCPAFRQLSRSRFAWIYARLFSGRAYQVLCVVRSDDQVYVNGGGLPRGSKTVDAYRVLVSPQRLRLAFEIPSIDPVLEFDVNVQIAWRVTDPIAIVENN